MSDPKKTLYYQNSEESYIPYKRIKGYFRQNVKQQPRPEQKKGIGSMVVDEFMGEFPKQLKSKPGQPPVKSMEKDAMGWTTEGLDEGEESYAKGHLVPLDDENKKARADSVPGIITPAQQMEQLDLIARKLQALKKMKMQEIKQAKGGLEDLQVER